MEKHAPTQKMDSERAATSDDVRADRRRFLQRTAIVGVPVILASVRGRNAWAWGGGATFSCQNSMRPSKACN